MSASSTVPDQSTKTSNDDDNACAYRAWISSEQKLLFDRMCGICEGDKFMKKVASRAPSGPSYPPEELDTDFKRNYPPDPFGDEVEPHARVWKIYRDEATTHDEPMVDLWNKTLDILLIFAGLFSAVETAFIVEAYKVLLPDYEAYTAHMLHAFASSGSGSFSVESLSGQGDPSVISVSNLSRWINGLWFLSLLLALAVALLCILTKQWVQYYILRINSPSSSPQQWARRRSLYYEGLLRWHIPGLISMLPILLHISLFGFLAGLVLFVWNLDRLIGLGLLSLTSVLLGFYIFCFVTPIWSIDSPSMSPLLEQLMSTRVHQDILRWLAGMIEALLFRTLDRNGVRFIDDEDAGNKVLLPSVAARVSLAVRRLAAALLVARGRVWFAVQDLWNIRFAFFYISYIYPPIGHYIFRTPEKSAEQRELDRRASELDAATISWLVGSASNHDTVRVALQATGSLHPASRGSALLREDPIVKRKAGDLIWTTSGTQDGLATSNSPADIARLLRVALSQRPLQLDQHGLYYRWDETAVCDYDLYLMSQILTWYTPASLRGATTTSGSYFPSLSAPRGPSDKSPYLHSTVLLLLGLRSIPLEIQLELIDFLDFSVITDEDAGHVTAALMPHAVRNGHTHTLACKRDCLVDILSDIALASASPTPQSSSPRIHSTSLALIRRLLRLQKDTFRAGMNWPSTASAQCCIGLVVPNFLDLLSSGLYNGSTQLEWYAAALFLSSALEYYGSTRTSPLRCEQLLRIVSTALCSIPPNELGVIVVPYYPLLEICSVVCALYHPRSLYIYRADRLLSLYRTQLQVAHDTCSLSDGLLPLLIPSHDGTTPSVWSVIVPSRQETKETTHTTALSLVLAIQLCSGARRGLLGISSLIDEFFAYDWGLDALRGDMTGVVSDSEAVMLHLLVQHCIELRPGWWETVRARVDAGDVTPAEARSAKFLPVDPRRGAASRRRDLRNYDSWIAKRRPGPCAICAACRPLEPSTA
ncbi:hypothetical protein EXIGLDRAFT_769951 [Exidia glandulosa HHB12029]|uniref:DUF6535 domain-containing protein n=1 Tax=Exidia glandulosa HHB12029 TaxID=1314781 RepID=A0A165H3W6_EXIGL|nr:hypothetical protein EXIGLDRAFT_769951 [Exidia glandulosa HHB12029]